MKTWAYRQDQLPSTHPIMAEINDLDDVLVNFDGITYAKGASVLKQLVAYVGMDEFFKGVQAYFKRHAYGNTRLSDLLGALEETSGRDLKTWSEKWLQTAGINILRPEIETDANGVITSFAIRQEAPALPEGAKGEPTLRPHRIAIGLYNLDDDSGKLVRDQRVELDVDGELTAVPELVGGAARRSSCSTTTTCRTPRSASTRTRSPSSPSTSATSSRPCRVPCAGPRPGT